METIHIVIATDDKYFQHCCTLITSILFNNKEQLFFFHILDGGISEQSKQKLNNLKLYKNFSVTYYDMKNFDVSFLPLNRSWISVSTYYRLFLTKILSNDIKKVLYLDCDIIVDGNIKEFWSEDISEYFAGVVEDEKSIPHSKRLGLKNYFNAGVLLLNLEKLRNSDFINLWTNYFKKNESIIKMQDQDILNGVFANNVKFLPLKWNANTKLFDKKDKKDAHFYSEEDISSSRKQRIIIHYTGTTKPWNFDKYHSERHLYFYYLLKSPYKNMIFYHIKEFFEYSMKNTLKNTFSIHNSTDKKHKILRVVGIKVKIKKKQFINK